MRYLVFASFAAAAIATAGAEPLPTPSPTVAPRLAATEGQTPAADVALGTVRIPRRVMADGKPLAAGTYRVRLTTQAAQPAAVGQSAEYWVEFLQGGEVKGREVASVVPQSEIKDVAESAPPAPNTARVEMLKGDDYLRVWINHGGNHYLIHLPPAS